MKRLITGVIGVGLAAASLAFAGAPAAALRNGPNHAVEGIHGGSNFNDTASYNWSGYAAEGAAAGAGTAGPAQTYTMVTGKWQVPQATCLGTTDENQAFWVGLDGFQDSTVEQGGTFEYCNGYTPEYWAWWEMYPTNDIQFKYSVFAGDFMTATVKYTSGKYKITVADATHKHSFTVTEACASGLTCSRTSAEWIGEDASFGGGEGNLAEWTNSKGQQQIGFYGGFAVGAPGSGSKIAMGNLANLWNISMVNSANTYNLAAPGVPGSQEQGFPDYWFAES
jgi:hypothetical protein